MKIIQSFWTGNKNNLTDSYGWLLPIFNYLSWIISTPVRDKNSL